MPKKPLRQRSLLVVEDKDDLREALTTILRAMYKEVIIDSARDYKEAIMKFDQTPFDLVLLDMRLGPGPDGLALLQALRGRSHPFRGIGITHYVNDYAYRAWQTGLDELLEKPVDPDKLAAAIDKQLASVSQQVQAKRAAFCVMPFSDNLEDRYLFGIKLAAERSGFMCNRSDKKYFTGDILAEIQRDIRAADVIIADISGNNPNVCYEVGFAHGIRKPVVLIAESAEGILFDIRNMRHIIFGDKIHKLYEELALALKRINPRP